MSSGAALSPEQRHFQLQLIWIVLFLLALLYCASYWLSAAQFFFSGATAQATVTHVTDVYDTRGDRVISRRVDYEYLDSGPKVTRSNSYYLASNQPFPGLGQTFPIQYLPNHPDSSHMAADNPMEPMCATIPILLLLGLRALSIRRGEW
jgi:hypothetical protein